MADLAADYEHLKARAKLAAKGSGLACHQEAYALIEELLVMRGVLDITSRCLTRRGRRKVRRWVAEARTTCSPPEADRG